MVESYTLHQAELQEDWQRARERQPLLRIDPPEWNTTPGIVSAEYVRDFRTRIRFEVGEDEDVNAETAEARAMRTEAGLPANARAWLMAVGFGLLAGYLLGRGASGSWTHAAWPVLAGLLLGVATALATPSRTGPVAFCAAGAAVAMAVATIALAQVQGGQWPLTDEVAIAQYGTATQAFLRMSLILAVLIGVPCMVGAILISVCRARSTHARAGCPR